MGRSRFVNGDSTRLDLSDGDWILVKHRLNTGERRAMFARLYQTGEDGQLRVNPFAQGITQVAAYLLDWSLLDDQGKPVVIRDKPVDEVAVILDNLDPDDFTEIRQAIETHEQAIEAAREAEKKTTRTGGSGSSPISPSPAPSAGASSGLPN